MVKLVNKAIQVILDIQEQPEAKDCQAIRVLVVKGPQDILVTAETKVYQVTQVRVVPPVKMARADIPEQKVYQGIQVIAAKELLAIPVKVDQREPLDIQAQVEQQV